MSKDLSRYCDACSDYIQHEECGWAGVYHCKLCKFNFCDGVCAKDHLYLEHYEVIAFIQEGLYTEEEEEE